MISLEQCQSHFDMKTITTRMVCAGYESGTVDSCMVSGFLMGEVVQCSGHSGGPTNTHCYSHETLGEHFWKMISQQMFIRMVMPSIQDPASLLTASMLSAHSGGLQLAPPLPGSQHVRQPREGKQLFWSILGAKTNEFLRGTSGNHSPHQAAWGHQWRLCYWGEGIKAQATPQPQVCEEPPLSQQ